VSWAIWITGRPGSGKSTLAHQVASALERRGERLAILEASAFAAEMVPGRSPSAHEWDIVYRALIRTATELTRAGVPVIIDATAHRRGWRELARAAISRFAEIQLVCPDEICGAREQAVRWSQMLSVGHERLAPAEPDIVLDYEYSLRAELTVNTESQHIWSALEGILLLIERLHARTAPDTPRSEGAPGAPGSHHA
jgi:adenylylsulfate kinase